ncbi:hypothetical protein GCM10008171_09470 [Methylopila jiangsuensis]|uniref:HTH merR-type domain-containing protein n=1 Tax=Methylopila jiangsuensis TaxID=586230 RepID=A0A9W6JG90_9HYPH|nr:MerR family transcriptional regulator [Methylopila jiangsuensis]MDR6285936.1 DNA-binding transcriptional MerR regulator [Methylopila jiangsuensis]GLK75693.1 hypothetical protein GCM10008171_09470 [Methylopila jiangsuensis]
MTDDGRPGAEKGPDAFRTISEVADDLGVPQHVLRFWETRFPQIRPIKRGGNRRYYRPNDVDLLRGVKHLLYGEGYTIRGVQRILREQGQRRVAGYADGGAPAPEPEDMDRPDDAPAERSEPRFEPEAETVSTPEPPMVARRDLAGPLSGPEMWAPQRRVAPQSFVPPAEPSQAEAAAPADDGNGAAANAGPSLAPEQVKRLRAALLELDACRRILEERL